MKRKSYSKDFKAKIVLEILREEMTLNELSSRYGVHVNLLRKWKKTALEQLPQLFDRRQNEQSRMQAAYEEKIERLYGEVGRLTTELSWLKKKSGFDDVSRRAKG
ncbi:transposase [Sporolactobacillus sp. Y61]|uniref:Transposase n=1 Tax=Sporolactobacillus sp. Y61 TaxID=3160863 RepID=A0AAU8IE49_9BACL